MSVTNKASLNYFSILFLFTCLKLSAQSVSKPAASAFLPNACGITVNAGPDITICAGLAKNLNGSVTGSTTYSWEPIDGLSNPNILNPSANPMSTTTYTLTARATSNNLITNGGFETGSIAPGTSQYTAFTNVNNLITSTGGYMIMSVPQIAMAFGCNPSIGAFALVVTPTGSAQNIWCQTIPVNPNTDYKIEYKVFGIPYIFGSPPSIGIKANGSLIGTVDAVSGFCLQADGSFIWNSGAATSCTFCLANYGGQGPGSICAIDDIIIRECCEEKDEVTVEVYELVAEAAPVEDIDCLNRPVTIDASGSSQGPGISYQWSTRNGHIVRGEQTLMPVVDTPGIYTLKITGLYGCEKELMVQVNGSVTPPDISIKKTDIDCKNPLGTLEASSKSTAPRFEWNGPNGFFSTRSILNNLKEPGEYTLKVTDAFGCESTVRVELLDNRSLLEAEILGDSISCGKDSALLKANSIARKPIYNWKGPGGFSKDSSEQIVARDSGWYFLTTTDSLGCSETDSFYVKNLAGSLPVFIAADTLTCSRLEVTLLLTTDTAAIVTWTGPNGFTSMQKQPKVSEPGWYYLLVSTPSGCRAVDSIQIFQSSDLPDISLSGMDTISCDQPSVLLSGGSSSAGARWEWITPNGTFQDSAQLHASDSGLYALVVTGMNGCKVSRNITIIKDIDPPGIIIQNDTLNCIKNQLALNATVTNSRSYQWSGPNGFSSNQSAPLINLPGQYTLTLTGMNGCQSTATVTILEDKIPPTLQLQADTINCRNPSITPLVNSDSTAIAYRWSGPNGFSSSMQTPLLNQGGSYQLRVTGKNGCETTGLIQVIEDLVIPSAMLESDTIQCKGIAEIRALNISPGAAINWKGPNGFSSSSATAVISISGYYVLQLTGTNGCNFIDSIFAFQKDQLPDIFAFDDTLSCKETSLFINAGSNSANVIFQWTGPNGFMSDIARPEVTDSGSYTLRVIDVNGCEAIRQIHIAKRTDLPVFQIRQSNNQISCLDSLVTVLVQSNEKAATLVWSGPNGFSSGLDSIQIKEPGTYILQFTSEFGCTSSDTVTIADFRTLPMVTVADDSINCIRTNVTLSLNTNDTGLNFLWSGPNNFSSTEQKPRIINGGTYTVMVSNAFGCTITRSILILADTLRPDIIISADTLTCIRPSAPVKASTSIQGFRMRWTGPNGFSYTLPQFATTQAGIYTCTITNPRNGCSNTAMVEVVEDTGRIRDVRTQVSSAACNQDNGKIQILSISGGRAPFRFSLDSGARFVADLGALDLAAGTYVILTEDVNGCRFFSSVNIQQNDSVRLDLIPTLVLEAGSNFNLNLNILSDPSEVASIRWSPSDQLSCSDCLRPVLTGLHDDVIRVTVTNKDGCTATASIRLTIKKEYRVFFPNVFSPNGDNINDFFYPVGGSPDATVLLMSIYDRWGNLVFQKKDFKLNAEDLGWNGLDQQQRRMNPGVYVYVVQLSDQGETHLYYGDLSLLY